MQRLSFYSTLHASPSAVWEHARTLRGINEELWPVRMSDPIGLRLDAGTPLNVVLMRSVLSLFGVLPIDVHSFRLLRVTDGVGFQEHSHSWLERTWIHERTITPDPVGCRLSDDLRFEPRLPAALTRALVERTFLRRHRALRRKFGGASC